MSSPTDAANALRSIRGEKAAKSFCFVAAVIASRVLATGSGMSVQRAASCACTGVTNSTPSRLTIERRPATLNEPDDPEARMNDTPMFHFYRALPGPTTTQRQVYNALTLRPSAPPNSIGSRKRAGGIADRPIGEGRRG